MMHIESTLKIHYKAITNRLRTPKGGITEPKVVRVCESFSSVPIKPSKRIFPSKIDHVTAAQIRTDYDAGMAIEAICKRFRIGKRTMADIRKRYGWPVRVRVKGAAKS